MHLDTGSLYDVTKKDGSIRAFAFYGYEDTGEGVWRMLEGDRKYRPNSYSVGMSARKVDLYHRARSFRECGFVQVFHEFLSFEQ